MSLSSSSFVSWRRYRYDRNEYRLARTVDPATRPVAVSELKAQVGLPADQTLTPAEEEQLDRYLDAAVDLVEDATDRSLITSTWVQSRTYWPRGTSPMVLGISPLIAVASVTYYDMDQAQQTWASTNYRVSAREPGVVYLEWEKIWPGITPLPDGIEITYTAGYGTTPASVPAGLRHAVLLLAAHWWDYRGSVSEANVNAIPFAVEHLLTRFNTGNEFEEFA